MTKNHVHLFRAPGFFSFERILRNGNSDSSATPGTTFHSMYLDSHQNWLVVKTIHYWVEVSDTDVLSKVPTILVFQHLAEC